MSNRTVLMAVYLSAPNELVQPHTMMPTKTGGASIQLTVNKIESKHKSSAFFDLAKIDPALAVKQLRAFADKIEATLADDTNPSAEAPGQAPSVKEEPVHEVKHEEKAAAEAKAEEKAPAPAHVSAHEGGRGETGGVVL